MSETKAQFTFVFSTVYRMVTFEKKKYCCVHVLEVVVVENEGVR